jgi:hypothetical protein
MKKNYFTASMRRITGYIKEYFYETDKRALAWVTLLTAILIFTNYQFGIDKSISSCAYFIERFAGRYIIFIVAFAIPYVIYEWYQYRRLFNNKSFLLLLVLSPAIFSLKAGMYIQLPLTTDPLLNDYWNHIIYWPVLLVIVATILFACWYLFDRDQPFYGTSLKNLEWKPYWIMLLCMVPLVTAASTQPDFLAVYPKLQLLVDSKAYHQLNWWHKLLFELSYGSDFVGIELFFRGFLVLAFIKWVGKDAILPMACFYCTIHFGKPLGECISSYFGGMLLGIVVANTRSLWGGLAVHLGIAWMMELGGYLGNLLRDN